MIWCVALLATSGCDAGPPAGSDDGASAAAPFTVDLEVAGYRAVSAGVGTAEQIWGSDGDLTDEPFTALEEDSTSGDASVVLISVTGFEGQEGGLSQSAFGRSDEQAFSLDRHDAIYSPPGDSSRSRTWSDLVVAIADDFAVRVTTPQATRGELVELFKRVETHGRLEPPSIEPPEGMHIVGSMDAHAAVASRASVVASSDYVPGTSAARSVGWVGEDDGSGTLGLVALPGSAADLDAIAVGQVVLGWVDPTVTAGVVDDRHYIVVDEDRPPDYSDRRAIWMEAPWGELLTVRAVGDELPSRDRLLELLLSVAPADDAAWEELVIEATGGPGLHADADRTELARGEVGALGWLLQTAPYSDTEFLENEEPDPPTIGVDECLKLSDRTRACGQGMSSAGHDWVAYSIEEEHGLEFVILSTTLPAASVRVTTRSDQATAPLHRVPGTDVWGAVVFVDDPGAADGVCDDGPPGVAPPQDAPFPLARIDALDADGNVVGCLGLGPGSHVGGI